MCEEQKASASNTEVLKCEGWQAFQAGIDAMTTDAIATQIMAQCHRLLVFSRHHSINYQGVMYDRQKFSEVVDAAATVRPASWSDRQAELVFLFYVMGVATLGLEQLDGQLSAASVERLVAKREALYADDRSFEGTLIQRAHRLPSLRRRADKDHYRYSIIDGERWHLTEGLIGKSEVAIDSVPSDLLSAVCASASGLAGLREATEQKIKADGDAESIVLAVMHHALDDPELNVDHVTITGPKWVRFPIEEEIGARHNIYRRTEIKEGLDLAAFEEQLGHTSRERLANVIGARMQVLKIKSAKHFYGSGCLAGEDAEKFGDYMIYCKEDSHYPGHRNGGISTGGRAPIRLEFEREGQIVRLPGIFADFRAVRLSHDPADQFDVTALMRVIQYAEWLAAILNTAYAMGAGITSDDAVGVGV